MRSAGKILAGIMDEIASNVKPGVSTALLDEIANDLCKKNNVEPAFLGYNDFPATLCVGLDDIAVHGIPSDKEVLKAGDLISIDMGIKHQGLYSDHACTFGVGEIDNEGDKLIKTTKLALLAGIKQALDGNTTGDIGNAIEQIAILAGFSVITVMTGHGIGKKLHEEPAIPCFGDPGKGTKLKDGMILAIEAMINEGESDLIFEDDGWTTRTIDGKRSAIFEHTVLVKDNSPEILTIK